MGAPPAAPPGGMRQHEEVEPAEPKQGERGQRQVAHPDDRLLLSQGDEGDDDGDRKGDGQPTVDLSNSFVPVQLDLL